jgi:oligopeptide transport system ATP-binding protein
MHSDTHVLLSVEHLHKYFPVSRTLAEFLRGTSKAIRAVDDVTFDVQEGTTFGLVGESGCGKTTTSRTILGIFRPTSGKVLFEGKDVHRSISKLEPKGIRREIQAVFQDPAGSLDPRMTIGEIVEEPLVVHRLGDRSQRRERTTEMLAAVGLHQEQYDRYPHELSGGQQQRVAIARTLALRPRLVILDEPVSALDMSLRAQILNLLKDIQTEFDLTYLFVSHDFSVVRYMCDRVAVMYLGRIVEMSDTRELFVNPLHPYTKALLDAVPIPDASKQTIHTPLPGNVPSPIAVPAGCRFHTRCAYAMSVCSQLEPGLIEVSTRHMVSCHLYPRQGS